MAIDFEHSLNPAQLEAVRATEGPVLVIAGAGSGKTRTIVYRLAHLVERGVEPSSILLLTFTRKAAQEMLSRASFLLGGSLTGVGGVAGGTFHSLAFATLRRHAALLGRESLTVLDRSDSLEIYAQAKESLDLGKGDRSFPKRETILEMVSKARNKELPLDDVLAGEALHLLPYAEAMTALAAEYKAIKARHGLLDYDDLLFTLEELLQTHEDLRQRLRARYRYQMVDEYQDTNLVQARLVRLLAGEAGNVMAVGDDAQSIYAFRGASVANILGFPQRFEGARVIRLEQNYRSTQPILDLTNEILRHAAQKFDKHLFTERQGGDKPRVVRTLSDATQHQQAAALIQQLLREHAPREIAVLFRAGYQSYGLEVLLTKLGIKYQKFGGIRFAEAAHIKDVLAYLRLVANPADMPAWQRVLKHIKGIGGRTAQAIFQAIVSGDAKTLAKHQKRFAELGEMLKLLDSLRARTLPPPQMLDLVLTWYAPVLIREYPDDHPRRQQGLDQLGRIAAGYPDLAAFLADMSLESPDEEPERDEQAIVLSTIHSAKGLEWQAVLLLDLVEDRFPSRRALMRPDDLEEERRLLYVACTRARESLTLFAPETVYSRGMERPEPARVSPFVTELRAEVYDSWREGFSGGLVPMSGSRRSAMDSLSALPAAQSPSAASQLPPGEESFPVVTASPGASVSPARLGYCSHKVYGRGKIIAEAGPGKYRVNFPGFGVKVIVAEYLALEDV